VHARRGYPAWASLRDQNLRARGAARDTDRIRRPIVLIGKFEVIGVGPCAQGRRVAPVAFSSQPAGARLRSARTSTCQHAVDGRQPGQMVDSICPNCRHNRRKDCVIRQGRMYFGQWGCDMTTIFYLLATGAVLSWWGVMLPVWGASLGRRWYAPHWVAITGPASTLGRWSFSLRGVPGRAAPVPTIPVRRTWAPMLRTGRRRRR
jgi:hypothetical protein